MFHIRRLQYHVLAIVVLIIIQTTSVFAVSEASCLFLLISPSPQANGMGGTYGNLAFTDPMASLFNPAYLGFFAERHNFGYSYSSAFWLPALVSDMDISCMSCNIGYTLKTIPLSFGLGYHHILLDLGEQVITSEEGPESLGTFESYDQADIASASVLLDYYIRGSIGLNFRLIESNLASFYVENELQNIKASANALDFGVALQIPIIDILSKTTHKSMKLAPNIIPFWHNGISYSTTNIGGEITYIDEAQSDPLPRNAYLGINSQIGLQFNENDFCSEFISYKFAYEIEGLLVERFVDNEDNVGITYLTSIFDVDSDRLIYKSGWELNMLDFFYLRRGHYDDDEGYINYDTDGWGFNFLQPIRWFLQVSGLKIENSLLKLLIYKTEIEFHHCSYKRKSGQPLAGTEFNGITLKLKTVL